MLIIGRAMTGFCCGLNGASFPVYNKEMSPNQIIAQGGVITHINFSIGCFIPALLGINLPAIGSNEN